MPSIKRLELHNRTSNYPSIAPNIIEGITEKDATSKREKILSRSVQNQEAKSNPNVFFLNDDVHHFHYVSSFIFSLHLLCLANIKERKQPRTKKDDFLEQQTTYRPKSIKHLLAIMICFFGSFFWRKYFTQEKKVFFVLNSHSPIFSK